MSSTTTTQDRGPGRRGDGPARVTCQRCSDGRHIRCGDKLDCACSVCAVGMGKDGTSWSAQPRARQPRQRRTTTPGPGRGANPRIPAGSSTLPEPAQRIVEIMVGNGAGDSEIYRALNRAGQQCTRDQVRTIRHRLAGLTWSQVRRAARAAA